MAQNTLSRNIADGVDSTPISVVDSPRLLHAALDQVEEQDGYWHKASAAAVEALVKWEQNQDVSGVMERDDGD